MIMLIIFLSRILSTVSFLSNLKGNVYHSFYNIYNGNIFPSLNPAKNFQFISRWTESTKSSAVGPNHRAVINTSNEIKSPLLWEFWIYNFSLRILERVLRWKHCKYKEWVSFFWVHGEWIVARNKQIGREPLRGSRDLFVPCYDSFPMNPEKRHSFLNYVEFENTFRHC